MVRGVAAHHAGLLPAFKECVEESFVRGLTKVVFATETLALGINMPARSVVLEKLVKYNGESHADVTPGEYTQLTGRAGRRGIDVEGHAVVLWQPGLDPRAVAGLASRRTYPLRSSFAPTYNMAVNLVGTLGRERARTLLEQSFAQFQSDRSVVGVARAVARNSEAIAADWAKATCDRGDFVDVRAAAGRDRRPGGRGGPGTAVGPAGRVAADPGHPETGRHHPGAGGTQPGLGAGHRPRHPRRCRDATAAGAHRGPPGPPALAHRLPGPTDRGRADADRQAVQPQGAGLPAQPGGGVPVQAGRARPGTGPDPRSGGRGSGGRGDRAGFGTSCAGTRATAAPTGRSTPAGPSRRCGGNGRTQRLQERMATRTNTIANHFDKICVVLESLGYLTGDGGERVSESGRMLARIYAELDLVAAECIRAGVFDGLTGPQLAAVLAALVYEARRSDEGVRRPRMPDAGSNEAMTAVRRIWREVSLVERDAKLPRGPEPDIGFSEVAYRWAAGRSLSAVLHDTDLTAGDFVRWVRQVLDFAGQIADAAGPGELRDVSRQLVRSMRRGVVSLRPRDRRRRRR